MFIDDRRSLSFPSTDSASNHDAIERAMQSIGARRVEIPTETVTPEMKLRGDLAKAQREITAIADKHSGTNIPDGCLEELAVLLVNARNRGRT